MGFRLAQITYHRIQASKPPSLHTSLHASMPTYSKEYGVRSTVQCNTTGRGEHCMPAAHPAPTLPGAPATAPMTNLKNVLAAKSPISKTPKPTFPIQHTHPAIGRGMRPGVLPPRPMALSWKLSNFFSSPRTRANAQNHHPLTRPACLLASFVQLRLVESSLATVTDARRHPNPDRSGMRFHGSCWVCGSPSQACKLSTLEPRWELLGTLQGQSRRLGGFGDVRAVHYLRNRRSSGSILCTGSSRSTNCNGLVVSPDFCGGYSFSRLTTPGRTTTIAIPGNTTVTAVPPRNVSTETQVSLSDGHEPQNSAKSGSVSPGLLHANPQLGLRDADTLALLEHYLEFRQVRIHLPPFCFKRAAHIIVAFFLLPLATSLAVPTPDFVSRESPLVYLSIQMTRLKLRPR
jgi:hypothetical protein